MNGMFNMHVMDESKTQLWRNSAYHKMGVKADKNIEKNKHNCSDNDEMQNSQ